jgi:hypothetical protein
MLYCPHCFEPLDNAYEPCRRCDSNKIDPSLQDGEDVSDQRRPPPRLTLYQDLTDPKFNIKKRRLVAVVLVALLLLGREGGFVNWYFFRSSANSKTQTPLYGEQYVESGDRATHTTMNRDLDFTFTTTGRAYGVGFQLPGGTPLAVDLKDEIQNNLKKQTQVTASVEEVTLTGLYWLPFLKSGSCKYRVRLQFVGKDSIVYTGVLDGVTAFDYAGLCSIRTLKQSLGDEIATRVVKSVDDVIHK